MCDYVAIKRMNGIDRLYLFYDTCVLHNFCLLNDDFDDSYFLDHHDGDDGDVDGGPVLGHQDGGVLAAQAKRVQLINIIC